MNNVWLKQLLKNDGVIVDVFVSMMNRRLQIKRFDFCELQQGKRSMVCNKVRMG